MSKSRKQEIAASRDQDGLSWRTARPGRPGRRQRPPIPPTTTPAERLAAIRASSRHNRVRDNDRTGEQPMTDQLVPLSVLALDTGTTATALAAALADQVLIDDLGRPAIDRPIAKQLIAEHQAALAAADAANRDRQAKHRAAIAAASSPVIDRVKAIQANQTARRQAGLIDDAMSAFAVLTADDTESNLARAGRRTDAYLSGRSEGYRYQISHTED